MFQQLDIWIMAGTALGLFLLMFVACVYVSALGRMVRKACTARDVPAEQLPGVTIVMAAHNQRHMLEANLPAFLLQHYGGRFEVMVAVDRSGTDGTLELLERMEKDYPHLRHTFVPSTARDVSRQRLALTLAIKGANYDRLLLTVPECSPCSPHWLSRMAGAFADAEVEVVLGPYVDQSAGRGGFAMWWRQLLWLVWAERHTPYRSGFANVGYDRRLFVRHNGFASHAGLVEGAVDIMVNQNANSRNTRVCVHPEAVMSYCSDRVSWASGRLFYMETRRHFVHGLAFRLWSAFMAVVPWLFHAGLAGVAVAGVWGREPLLAGWAGVLWLAGMVAMGVNFNRSWRALGLTRSVADFPIRWLAVLPGEVRIRLRYLFADKGIFRKKFI